MASATAKTTNPAADGGVADGSSPQLPPQKLSPDGLVLVTETGRTTIQPHVVAKIAGLAVREVPGVFQLVAFGTGQTISSFAKAISGNEMKNLGVNVEVGQLEAAVDVRLITEYGSSIPAIAMEVRENVTSRIREMTGLHVTEVNVEVVDLHFHEDERETSAAQRRVQ